jgi:hypothetical protein
MKTTENFKKAIEVKLNEMAAADELFAKNLKKEGKNIDDCINYILNTVQKSGCNGFTDDEIFGMAAHYYDEDQIEVGNPIDCRITVNHVVELTEEEIQEAKAEAKRIVISQEQERLRPKTPPKTETPKGQQANQPSLF